MFRFRLALVVLPTLLSLSPSFPPTPSRPPPLLRRLQNQTTTNLFTKHMAPRPPGHAFVLALYRAFSRLHSAYAFPSSHRDGVAFNNPHVFGHGDIPEEEPGSVGFWTHLLISVALVLAGGVFAGYVRLFFYLCHRLKGLSWRMLTASPHSALLLALWVLMNFICAYCRRLPMILRRRRMLRLVSCLTPNFCG